MPPVQGNLRVARAPVGFDYKKELAIYKNETSPQPKTGKPGSKAQKADSKQGSLGNRKVRRDHNKLEREQIWKKPAHWTRESGGFAALHELKVKDAVTLRLKDVPHAELGGSGVSTSERGKGKFKHAVKFNNEPVQATRLGVAFSQEELAKLSADIAKAAPKKATPAKKTSKRHKLTRSPKIRTGETMVSGTKADRRQDVKSPVTVTNPRHGVKYDVSPNTSAATLEQFYS